MTEPAIVRVTGLPASPLSAAATFHAQWLPQMRESRADLTVIVFSLAGHDHRGWRLAVVQELARAAAPRRVIGVAGDDEPAIVATIAYLADAHGVTGQLLAVDGNEAQTS